MRNANDYNSDDLRENVEERQIQKVETPHMESHKSIKETNLIRQFRETNESNHQIA